MHKNKLSARLLIIAQINPSFSNKQLPTDFCQNIDLIHFIQSAKKFATIHFFYTFVKGNKFNPNFSQL
jgi:hypothetical protein